MGGAVGATLRGRAGGPDLLGRRFDGLLGRRLTDTATRHGGDAAGLWGSRQSLAAGPSCGEREADPGGREAAVDEQAGAERELAERVGGREAFALL